MAREIIEGKIQGNERGYAFLIPNDTSLSDYFIPHHGLKDAMHGDTVLAERTRGEGTRTTARVLKVIERGISKLVGTFFSHKAGGFVRPDDKKYYNDIYVSFSKGLRAKTGDKVVVKIITYPKRQNPEGMIVEILGRQFEKNAELKSILFNYKLPEKFDKKVLDYANGYGEFSQKDLKKRADFTSLMTFTIDGEDARDFDDAVSIEKLPNGDFKLGVHIADVSHYVKQNDIVDKQAFERATSVYFPEKVIPMLPERLCNDLCSLKENEIRPTLSCVMIVAQNGTVKDYQIVSSAIKSSARLTYTAVQKMLDGDKELAKKYSNLTQSIFQMNELADILIKRREIEGSIDLDVKESDIIVDKSGEIFVQATKRDKAHRIIEEFMILANCTVAEYMYFLEQPFIYRVHGEPTQDKLTDFYGFLSSLGINAKHKKDGVFPKDFQSILKSTENKPTYSLINRVMLRSMQKAKYSPICDGHFGLSLKHYCHFTSPIRRYPDLVIHRIIKDFLDGKTDIEQKYGQFVFSASEQSSTKERNAIDAERAVDDFYKVMFISGYIGEVFDGIISGVKNFGIFVELENGIEGLIKIDNLPGKRYIVDEKHFLISNTKNTFKLGQKVKIKVAGVNLGDKRAEFILEE